MSQDNENSKAAFHLIPEILCMSESKRIDEIFTEIERFAKEECKSISTHQLRGIYGRVMQAQTMQQLKMVRSYIANLSGKASNNNETRATKQACEFWLSLLAAADVEQPQQRAEVRRYFEGIVAYHRYHFGELKDRN
jgi:CRISPR/Cas system CSM-associated protein Csm2 small subunit